MTTAPTSVESSSLPWWKQLNSYHWFVFLVASLAWLFDCLDQQLFLLAREGAITDLLPAGTDKTVINQYGGYATSIFIIGWAMGGLIFGAMGDRVGRAKMLTVTVLIYSVCTGLSAFSQGWIDFAAFRFLTGLGVGGVFGLAVALVADSVPDGARTGALGLLQALSAVGNVAAGIISMVLGSLAAGGTIESSNMWKIMFLVGALPAFLCVFIQMRLKEPEKWVKAREAGRETGVKFGSYSALLGDARWRGRAIFGMMLCVSGVIGLWGIGFFSPELVGGVISQSLRESGVAESEIAGRAGYWKGTNMIVQNVGAFFGMIGFTILAQRIGRKPAFTIGFLAAMGTTIAYFQLFNGVGDIWMSFFMGACQLGLFAGFAIYLPELFPTSLRSTGTSFCYNVGRFIAASGPFVLGHLQAFFAQGAETPGEKTDAFRNACCYMSAIFLLGLVALLFLPETKGRPLPEE